MDTDQITIAHELLGGEGEIWELFNMNSKITSSDLYAPSTVIAETMRQMPLSFRAESQSVIPLPAPDALKSPKRDLAEAMLERSTPQNLVAPALTLTELATLLYSCAGQNRSAEEAQADRPFRVVPSGGALYPLEVYVHCKDVTGLDAGIYHYDPLEHGLRLHVPGDQTERLSKIVVQPDLPVDTSVQVMFTMIPARLVLKYGNRGYRFALMEAGHAAQNAIIASRGMGYDALPVGGYRDEELERLLGIDGVNHVAAYMTFVGKDQDA
ncbi:SagB/ThcOx family dehydrogenase [Rhodobacteraceae bacterium N5(2021)]|uniref:SagB/ThcOx family dehydrogenase n=1 Tax=Gymnodinialimonas phycosphaerae TaxID=2841589 RepID=A0A975TVE8_9RHOB|nr:SagB/ThcOx family dehydrogenase [Gymnodinialimonas phycosphaerae]MBY4891197.1 SagB/ThcOx family dehydrogenase [Gymnodinialimonas phycosphaerae]